MSDRSEAHPPDGLAPAMSADLEAEAQVGPAGGDPDGGQSVTAPDEPVTALAQPGEPGAGTDPAASFLGQRGPRWRVESVFVRLIATSGIVGISVALAAILGTQDVAFWIIGLTVSLVSVVLAAILWSSRTL
jgi:hypothetical protein